MSEWKKFGIATAAAVVGVALFWGWWLTGQQRVGEPFAVKLPADLTVAAVWTVVLIASAAALGGTFEYTRRSAVRLSGVGGLLTALLATLLCVPLFGVGGNPADASNGFDVLNFHGMYGVIGLGVAALIITGEIDLSIGSVAGLAAVLFGVLMKNGVHPLAAAGLVILAGAAIGLGNGLLVTGLRLQSFLVTLCGMFVYRGVARSLTNTAPGISEVLRAQPDLRESLAALRLWVCGKAPDGGLEFPAMFVVMLLVAGVLAVLLHRTAYGRYWYAIGYNERAAVYAGVGVRVQRIAVFVGCSALAALGGILLYLNSATADPTNAGATWELTAITAAVLGGVSLKGGEGTAVGVVFGALLRPVISNLITFLNPVLPWVNDSTEPWVMGLILLFGTVADELIRRRSKVNR
jgi:ribose transport system permease protein